MNHTRPTPRRPIQAGPSLATPEAACARRAALWALGMGLLACSGSAAPDTTSTFQGALSVDTFPQRPESVQASNELGDLLRVPVTSGGDFRIELSRDHSYTLAVRWGTERVSVVFPRASGQLTSQFDVSSGAAVVSLGTVRYFAAAPPGGFFLKSAYGTSGQLASSSSDSADGEVGECVDGMISGTGALCVDDDGDVACEGDHSDGDGECENGTDTTTGLACVDPPEASDGDGECENGVDSSTGLPCTDPEDVVDPNQPMAIAEHNVPSQVGGCDEGGGEESDD